jgi:hypothetical protein
LREVEHAATEQMSKQYTYLAKREERMRHSSYQQAGWAIGSGIVESGNKVVMQLRTFRLEQ